MRVYTDPINATPDPCESFRAWEGNPDDRIAFAGARLRVHWCEKALAIPALIPLTSIVMRAWRERWPDPATAGGMIYGLAQIADYITGLEARANGGAQ